jgi:hypothetical protein
MHLVDELSFLGCVALAAAVLSALYWWDVSAESETDPPPNQIPNQSPPENPT